VITDIDFDHQKFLGHTLPEIAHEKAGIMRSAGTVVLLPQHPQVNDALGREIMERNARPVNAVKHMPPVAPSSGAGLGAHNRFPLEFMGHEIDIDSPLAGRHQLRNMALAITTAEELHQFGFKISGVDVEEGVRRTRWPGRFQVFPAEAGHPETVLDVAHNPAGAWALRSTLSTLYPDRPLTLVFGAMRDKAIPEIAAILFPLAEHVIATRANNPRAATPQAITEAGAPTHAEILEEETIPAAVEKARRLAGAAGVVVITGSIYIVGEALALLAQSKVRQSI